MDPYIQMFLTILMTTIASSGFWVWLGNRSQKKSLHTELLIGLAHNELMDKGLQYINRGSITQDEYENLYVYLYKPYENLGGNGSVKRIMAEVDKLPIRKDRIIEKVTGDNLP